MVFDGGCLNRLNALINAPKGQIKNKNSQAVEILGNAGVFIVCLFIIDGYCQKLSTHILDTILVYVPNFQSL